MKNIIKCMLLLSLFFCLESKAQQPGDSRVLSDNSTFKGKVELWRERKVQHHERKMDKKAEHKARKKNTYGGVQKKESGRKERRNKRRMKSDQGKAKN